MKKLSFILSACLLALALTGCGTFNGSTASKNASNMLANLPSITASDITQSTSTPFYAHQESVSGLSYDADSGTFEVTNLKASASIPELGVVTSISITGISFKATAAQLAARAALLKATPAK